MFFVLIFLILAATTSYLFPEWSWATILLLSLGCVATLRLLLAVGARSSKDSSKSE